MLKVVRGQKYMTEFITNKVLWKHRDKIKRDLYNFGKDVTDDLKRVLTTGTRSGRIYYIKGQAHQASAPGEPPASRSGKLADGFEYKARTTDLLIYSEVTSRKGYNYPLALEEGNSKIKPRPYFDITCKANAYKLERDLQRYDL